MNACKLISLLLNISQRKIYFEMNPRSQKKKKQRFNGERNHLIHRIFNVEYFQSKINNHKNVGVVHFWFCKQKPEFTEFSMKKVGSTNFPTNFPNWNLRDTFSSVWIRKYPETSKCSWDKKFSSFVNYSYLEFMWWLQLI